MPCDKLQRVIQPYFSTSNGVVDVRSGETLRKIIAPDSAPRISI
jgi:hypothetical protein